MAPGAQRRRLKLSASNNFHIAATVGVTPEIKYFDSGTCKVSLRVAIQRPKKGGEKQEAIWLDCIAWGKTAELISEHFDKGDGILLQGEFDLEEWTDKESQQQRRKPVLNVREFGFLPGKKQDKDGAEPRQAARAAAGGGGGSRRAPAVNDFDDEIPF